MHLFQLFLILTFDPFCDVAPHISSGYSPFSDWVGLPLHNTPSPELLMKSNGAVFLQPTILP